MAQRRWDEAETAGRRAVEIDPRFIFGWTWLSLVLSGSGRFDEAYEVAKNAVPIDPLSPMAWTMGGWALSAGRRFSEAEPPLRRALELNPDQGLALWNLGVALAGQGRYAEASTVLEHAEHGEPAGASLILGMLAWVEAAQGQTESARRRLDEIRDWAKFRYVPRYVIAWTLGALGEIESALDEYDRSVEEGDAFLSYPLWPGNDPYRQHPRFKAALERLGLGWANRIAI
jgi:superkiller protein 3